MPDQNDDTSVHVALRVRPQLAKERIDMCRVCTSVTPGHPQIMLGQDRAFTYDYVFDMDSRQESIYNATVHKLIEGCFEGYNATVFAYGQTGAGKTFTMGTGFEPGVQEEDQGIVPRAVRHLFDGIEARRQQAQERSEPPPEFKIHAQFMELYNEDILDLFDTARDDTRVKRSHIRIHEDATGGIYVVGVTTRTVVSEQETLQCLQAGALSRTTASTNMNSQSSRSHAIFTLHIKQQRLVRVTNDDEAEEGEPAVNGEQEENGMNEFETLTAKFHFVDLAGSERLKRTGATGDRAKEGISINCGLLALGNVISALGDPVKKSAHVPYRDSKLTRLLQDSLGGNSRTLMIACISPSDRDFMETLNTMRYANRARNIKNAIVANQDKTSRQIAALRAEVKKLQEELVEYKQGKRMVNEEGVEEINDLFHENTMLQRECENLRQRCKAMQETIDSQTARIAVLVAEQAKSGMLLPKGGDADSEDNAMMSMVEGYIKEIEDLRAKLVESESLGAMLRRKTTDSPVKVVHSRNSMNLTGLSPSIPHLGRSSQDITGFEIETPEDTRVASILAEARKQVEHDQEKLRQVEFAGERPRTRTHSTSSTGKRLPHRVTKYRCISGSDKENEDVDVEDVEHPLETLTIDEPIDDGVEEIEEENEVEGDAEDADEEMGDEDSESDSELDEEEQHQLQENLADIACEITIKQRLIEELEASQRRLHTLRAQYEEKLSSLQSKIKETESERDKVLNNLGSLTETRTKEKAEKIRKEFEIKLGKLSAEKDRLQKASREHTKLMKSKSQYERQMKTLQCDLADMKKLKVTLMKQIREEQKKSRQKETERNREIQALKKESRKRDNQIKSLEAQARQKENVLRRKHEELQALRKQKKPMSDKVAGRTTGRRSPHLSNIHHETTSSVSVHHSNGPVQKQRKPLSAATQKRRHQRRSTSEYSSKTAKHKWQLIERRLNDIIARRQTISHMERDMERFLHHRHRLSKKLDKHLRRRDEAIKKGSEQSTITEYNELIEGLNANVEYVQEQIMECQANIMEVMEGKDEVDAVDAAVIIQNCSLQESKYINEHFLNVAINKGLAASQKEAQIRELEAKLHQEENNSFLQTQLLQHVLQGSEVEADDLFTRPDNESSSSESSRAPSPVMGESSAVTSGVTTTTSTTTTTSLPNAASMPTINLQGLPQFDHPPSMLPQPVNRTRDKARRRTATHDELLYAGQKDKPDAKPLLPMRDSSESSTDEGSTMSDSMLMPPPKAFAPKRDSYGRPGQRSRESSPANTRRRFSNHALSDLNNSANNTPTATPPGSPPAMHRIRNENVFSRLTQSTSPAVSRLDKGCIQPVQNKMLTNTKSPLVCCYTAEGHTKAVLSVQATDELLFSGSKDRTVKIWKLSTGQEQMTLSGHPNNVVAVRYCPKLNLVFSVSTAYVRVWDIRDSGKCIKTLSSAGLVLDSNAGNSSSRTVAMPTGETQINDITVNEAGTRLYAATGNIVRVWDLNSFQSTCKLYGGASAAVMCVAVNNLRDQPEVDQVFAGSKDHYVKMFEVSSASSGCLTPKFNLDPPHYDGIQSIAINKGLLFSGSRDACIKKWDLDKKKQLKSINGAHKDWICSLDFLPGRDCLISGCRGGILKIWQTSTCSIVGEMKAHTSPINSIATNSTHVFTASSDTTVSVWQPKGEES